MDEVWPRIPHIFEQINESLDNKSLIRCKEASRTMCLIIENQKSGKYVTTRMIQSYTKNPEEHAEDWRIIFKKLPLKRLKEFGILVEDFYKSTVSRFEENWNPLHIAAERGNIDFCKFIVKVRAPKQYNFSPLLFSAQAGHIEVSKFLYKEIEDKNHRTSLKQLTAQHLAAKNGHLEIYTFLHENSHDINPSMQRSITPLHLAAQYGHFDVCKYICDNTVVVAPRREFDEMTPLSLAIHRGHSKIARLLIERNGNNFGVPFVLFFVCIMCFMVFLWSYVIFYDNFCILNPLLGAMLLNVCKSVNDPIAFISKIIVISICYISASLTSLDIVSELLFYFFYRPKLEY
jgi:ankyrin repeat protein